MRVYASACVYMYECMCECARTHVCAGACEYLYACVRGGRGEGGGGGGGTHVRGSSYQHSMHVSFVAVNVCSLFL